MPNNGVDLIPILLISYAGEGTSGRQSCRARKNYVSKCNYIFRILQGWSKPSTKTKRSSKGNKAQQLKSAIHSLIKLNYFLSLSPQFYFSVSHIYSSNRPFIMFTQRQCLIFDRRFCIFYGCYRIDIRTRDETVFFS